MASSLPSRITAFVALASVVAVAGCGDDKDEGADTAASDQTIAETSTGAAGQKPVGNLGGREAANALVACFKVDGYKAQILPTPFGTAAALADAKGYPVTSVLLNSDKGALNSTAVSFFESEARRKEATRKLKLDFGSADVPEPDERGSAAVEYVAKPARPATRQAVLDCLGP